MINVGHPRRYIYSLRLTSWNKIEEGSNLQACQVWRQRGRAEGTLSTSTIPTFIFPAGSLPTEGDSQKVIDSTPIGSTRIFSSEPLVSLIEKSCSSGIHRLKIHHHISIIVLGLFKIWCSFKRLISWSNPWFSHFLMGQKTNKALRLNIKYLFKPGPLFISRMTCQNCFLKTSSATTIDAITYSLCTRVFKSALASTSTSKVPKNTTLSAAHVSTYVANGVFISTLTSVTASKSTSASTSVSATVSTSVLAFASNYETPSNSIISSPNFPISVWGTASFLTTTTTTT